MHFVCFLVIPAGRRIGRLFRWTRNSDVLFVKKSFFEREILVGFDKTKSTKIYLREPFFWEGVLFEVTQAARLHIFSSLSSSAAYFDE